VIKERGRGGDARAHASENESERVREMSLGHAEKCSNLLFAFRYLGRTRFKE
jgi:hypothetical protein